MYFCNINIVLTKKTNDMKKIATLWTILAMMMLTMSFTSCTTEDQDIAYYLSGEWQGQLRSADGKRYDITMYFDQDGDNFYATHGYGYEIDHGWWGRNTRIGFDWAVRDGRIFINYYDGTHVIVDYDHLPHSHEPGARFSGFFVDSRTREDLAEFYLVKTGAYYYFSREANTTEETE